MNETTQIMQQHDPNVIAEFPYNLPADEKVEVRLDLSVLRDINQDLKDIFCSFCGFPMNLIVQLQPCEHLICEDCFTKYSEECKKCGLEICGSKKWKNEFI